MTDVALSLNGEGARTPTRRSARNFAAGLLTFDGMSSLLGTLRRHAVAGKYKYAYASAGALYAVRAYILARKPERYGVADVAAGSYCYRPDEHRLCGISPSAPYDSALHAPVNRPVFLQSAFTIFLVLDPQAVEPTYGREALRMACVEAGMMAQVLERAAASAGMGVCHIGYPASENFRSLFELNDEHALLHTLLVGKAPNDSAS